MSTLQTVALKTPVVVEGKTITAITLRPAKARDLRSIEAREKSHADEGPVARVLWLITLLSGLSDAEADDLCAEDFSALATAVPVALGEDQPAEPKT